MYKKLIVLSVFLIFKQGNVMADTLPQGALQEGSLSNQKLINDTMQGVVSNIAAQGCEKIDTISPYVTQMPKGSIGQQIWREMWIVTGCSNTYPLNITFIENSTGVTWIVK